MLVYGYVACQGSLKIFLLDEGDNNLNKPSLPIYLFFTYNRKKKLMTAIVLVIFSAWGNLGFLSTEIVLLSLQN